MEKRNNNYSENRKSARIPDSFQIHYKMITQKEYEKLSTFYINRRTANRPASKRYEADALALDWISLENETGYNPFLVQLLSYIDKKMDMILFRQEEILKHLTPSEQKGSINDTGECIDISGTGLNILTDQNLKKETILELLIEPIIYPPVHIVTLGKVLRTKATRKKERSGFEVSVRFTSINEDDREELIKYIFKRQRELISSRKKTDDFI